eukprot:7321482-Pyramimonas_sp.AAC.1
MRGMSDEVAPGKCDSPPCFAQDIENLTTRGPTMGKGYDEDRGEVEEGEETGAQEAVEKDDHIVLYDVSQDNVSLDQLETVFVVTGEPWMPQKKPRKHFENCTTAGTIIGPVGVPTADTQ